MELETWCLEMNEKWVEFAFGVNLANWSRNWFQWAPFNPLAWRCERELCRIVLSLSVKNRANVYFERQTSRWAALSRCRVVRLYRRCDKDIKVSYTVYNRLSVLLKSLLAITRVTPAYKLSRKQGHDYVILYRWVDSCLFSFFFISWTVFPFKVLVHDISVCISVTSRIYFGEVQLSGLGEGKSQLLDLTCCCWLQTYR